MPQRVMGQPRTGEKQARKHYIIASIKPKVPMLLFLGKTLSPMDRTRFKMVSQSNADFEGLFHWYSRKGRSAWLKRPRDRPVRSGLRFQIPPPHLFSSRIRVGRTMVVEAARSPPRKSCKCRSLYYLLRCFSYFACSKSGSGIGRVDNHSEWQARIFFYFCLAASRTKKGPSVRFGMENNKMSEKPFWYILQAGGLL